MARRIDIELTSARPDGTWTWRAAGALQPRGVLDGGLLYQGAKTGDVVRADAEFEIDGITITAVLPPKQKRAEPEKLELLGPARPQPPGVTTTLVRANRGPAGRRDRDGERTGPRPPRREAAPERRAERSEPRPRRASRTESPAEASEGNAATGGQSRRIPPRTAPREKPPARDSSRERAQPARAAPTSDRGRRLSPNNAHRAAVLDSLPPEERPIAEQVLRGGIPAVRTALHLEREKADAEGRPPPNAEALLAIAEGLLPRLKAAEWRDRAEAAVKGGEEITLRDLRSVVAGADMARDEESRQLATSLREALERRIDAQRQEWLDSVGASLDEGRIVRSLRLSARPPDPGIRFPADLATRLAQAAGNAMGPETPADRWAALLDAVLVSPVRRSVRPVGLPAEPGEELLHTARQASGRIPALAPMLGVKIPPPPGPPRSSGPGSPHRLRKPSSANPPSSGPASGGGSPADQPPADQPPADQPPADHTEAAAGPVSEGSEPTKP
jgi:hypothetical protein